VGAGLPRTAGAGTAPIRRFASLLGVGAAKLVECASPVSPVALLGVKGDGVAKFHRGFRVRSIAA
jgi:hypothetical protein